MSELEASVVEARPFCSRMKALPVHPLRFAGEARVLPMLSSVGIRLDLVFATLPAERDLIARAHPKQLGSRPVNVATVEDPFSAHA